jgi:parallel beta-helix repeat protein
LDYGHLVFNRRFFHKNYELLACYIIVRRVKVLGRIKAGLVSSVWVLLMFVAVFSVVLKVSLVKGDSGTIYIRADGSIYPPTAPISTVDNVTYTIIDNLNESVVVERDNIVVDGAGHTVRGGGSGIGIDLSAKSNVTIKNMEIREFSLGIELNQSSNNTVSENNVTSNYLGIHLWSSSNNILSRNNITNKLAGIYLGFSPNNMIFQNRFVGCGLSVDSFSSLVVDNTVNGKPLVYLENVSDYVVSCAGQVILMNCENIRVEGTDLCNASIGIGLCKTNNTHITSNNITNNAIGGISLAFSSNNSISGNRITNNTVGIDLWDSSNDTLSSNVISGNKYSLSVLGSKLEDFLHSVDASNLVDGKPVYYWVNKHGAEISSDVGYVAIVNCTEIAVRNLTLTNNGEGLLLAYTRNSYISNNTIANNSYGIYLFCSSNNSILGNRITSSECGIRVYSSSDNSVYHNNFIDNTAQVDTYNSVNVWDGGYPSGGNYWSDYRGSDAYSGVYQNETGYDWIGDSPYVIDHPYIIDRNNTDKYPLMFPFVPEIEETRIAYRNLLLKYTEMHSEFEALNSTLYELLGNVMDLRGKYDSLKSTINDMQEQIISLNSTCKDLQESIENLALTFNWTYNNLQGQINSLNQTCVSLNQSLTSLQGRIDSLNSTLQTSINKLQEQYNSLSNQLNNVLNVTYVFITATVILIAATVYLARRKPKQ